MNCCDSYGKCTQGYGCPARETRGQALHAERKWGEMPIQFVGSEPDTDKIITRDFIKGALFAFISAVIVVCIAVASYFI